MDFNMTVLCGRLASTPEIKTFDSGSVLTRLLITVRSEQPRLRVDVLPVSWWDSDPDITGQMAVGDPVWVCGALQRRFWSASDGRRSRLEVVAHEVSLRKADAEVEGVA